MPTLRDQESQRGRVAEPLGDCVGSGARLPEPVRLILRPVEVDCASQRYPQEEAVVEPPEQILRYLQEEI